MLSRFRSIPHLAYRNFRRNPVSSVVSPTLVTSIKPSLISATESVSSFSTSSPASIWPPKSPVWRFLKLLSLGTLGVVGVTGWATHAYTVQELDDRTREFRKFADQHREGIESLIFSPMAGAAYVINVYLAARSGIVLQVISYSLISVFTLVLDLTETLVSSNWKRAYNGDEKTFKRPELDAFLESVYEMGYEVVLYTDEMMMGVEFLTKRLKDGGYFHTIISRGSTVKQDGKCYRDLSRLNRDMCRILYVSGHALENCLQPENSVLIKPWKKEETDDTTLVDLLPFLEYVIQEKPDDIRQVLSAFKIKGIDICTTKEYLNIARVQANAESGGKVEDEVAKVAGWLAKEVKMQAAPSPLMHKLDYSLRSAKLVILGCYFCSKFCHILHFTLQI